MSPSCYHSLHHALRGRQCHHHAFINACTTGCIVESAYRCLFTYKYFVHLPTTVCMFLSFQVFGSLALRVSAIYSYFVISLQLTVDMPIHGTIFKQHPPRPLPHSRRFCCWCKQCLPGRENTTCSIPAL